MIKSAQNNGHSLILVLFFSYPRFFLLEGGQVFGQKDDEKQRIIQRWLNGLGVNIFLNLFTGEETISYQSDGNTILVPQEPFINSEGEWELSPADVEAIAIGAGILGTGGGGSPYIGKLRCLKVLQDGKKIRVVTPER